MNINTIRALTEVKVETLVALNWLIGLMASGIMLALVLGISGEGPARKFFLAGALVAAFLAFYFFATDTRLFPLPKS